MIDEPTPGWRPDRSSGFAEVKICGAPNTGRTAHPVNGGGRHASIVAEQQ